jgi:hypothetical protein
MMVDAKKISDVEPFQAIPQQSDYVVAWDKTAAVLPAGSNGAARNIAKRVFRSLPLAWQQRIEGHRTNALYSFRNKDFYRKLP